MKSREIKVFSNSSIISGTGRFQHPAIEMWAISKLRPAARNARTHSKKQCRKLIAVIRRFGFIDPIIVDENGTILSGHLRYEAAGEVGLKHVPVIPIAHLTDLEKRAYALAANRIALDAGWDREILAAELGELAVLLPDAKIDIATTGFDIAETDILIGDQADPPEIFNDELPAPGPLVTRPNDLWVLGGKHRLFCGDARDSASYATLMGGETAAMAFTDPPYNVSIKKHARGRSRVAFREFAVASGELTDREFYEFLDITLSLMADACADGSIIYVCMDWRHLRLLLEVGFHIFAELKNICVWVKQAGQGSFYRSSHEMICVFKKGTGKHLNSFELGQHGRSRTNVWEYPGFGSFKAGAKDELNIHPTMKPIQLVRDVMLDCSQRGSIVIDPFMGSGTTLIAGEMVGRRVYGMEIDPQYVDLTIRRWQKFTGKDAVLEATGKTFDEVMAALFNESIQTKIPARSRQKVAKGNR